MQLQFHQLVIPPGNQLLLTNISWQMFENLLEELGETRAKRLSYNQGTLEIMVPLPEHEIDKEIIGDLVKILLEELGTEFIALGSTTFKNSAMARGVEPDQCFYIQHEATMRGKSRINLAIDPPPDLAIEIDLTSRTPLGNYEALGVPELWRYEGKLRIYVLQQGKYVESPTSSLFPQFPLRKEIPRYVYQSTQTSRNQTMRAFREWVRGIIEKSRPIA